MMEVSPVAARRDSGSSCEDAQAMKEQFRESGVISMSKEQFIKLMLTLNAGFRDEDLHKVADDAFANAFTGGERMCCSALVDYLFGAGASGGTTLPSSIVMGDLGSGKTSCYLFVRTESGVQVKELMDGDRADLPSLSSCTFEEWSSSFSRACGEYIGECPVHIGATAWYREMPEEQQVELGLRLRAWGQASFPHGFRLLEVTGLKEANFESIACRHACEAVLRVTPDVILSSGTGSMQCSAGGESASISLDTKAWSQKPRDQIDAFREAARQTLRSIEPMLRTDCSLALLLGASWYAIVAAGMVDPKGEPTLFSREQAMLQLSTHASKPDTSMRDAVNIWRIYEALGMMSLKEVVFARNWKVHGEDFRTTWSVGYFIDGCP